MKEMNLRQPKVIEIDDTMLFQEYLLEDDLKVSQEIKVVTYYLEDGFGDWAENPIFSLVTWGDSYEIVHHNFIDVFNNVYNVLVKYEMFYLNSRGY